MFTHAKYTLTLVTKLPLHAGKRGEHTKHDTSLKGSGDVRSKSMMHTMHTFIECSKFATGKMPEALKIVAARVGREESQSLLVQAKVACDVKRHFKDSGKITEKNELQLLAAKESLQEQHVMPGVFNLAKLTAHVSTYPVDKMVTTLVERERRGNLALDVAARTAELLKMKSVPLRQMMVSEFYGDDYGKCY